MLVCFGTFALWVLPIAVALRARASSYRWATTGAAFGVVVSPASLGTYCVGMALGGIFVGLPLALVGLPLAMFHGSPGFQLATTLGLRSSGVVEGVDRVVIEIINAGLWATVYALLGFSIDSIRRRRSPIRRDARPTKSLQSTRQTTPRG